jgi:hypothetical protein
MTSRVFVQVSLSDDLIQDGSFTANLGCEKLLFKEILVFGYILFWKVGNYGMAALFCYFIYMVISHNLSLFCCPGFLVLR